MCSSLLVNTLEREHGAPGEEEENRIRDDEVRKENVEAKSVHAVVKTGKQIRYNGQIASAGAVDGGRKPAGTGEII